MSQIGSVRKSSVNVQHKCYRKMDIQILKFKK